VNRRSLIRLAFAFIVVSSTGVVVSGYVSEPTSLRASEKTWERSEREGTQVVEPRENVTVVSALGSRLTNGQLIAYGPSGEVIYHGTEYDGYGDVDPVPGTERTVLYAGHEELNASACDATTRCLLNVIETVNLTTGETTRLHSHKTPYPRPFEAALENGVRWHDVDRVDEDHVAVADISRDRVFVLNTTSGHITWSWNAQESFPLSGGGPYPYDWTHVNDVEVLDDGRIMVSLRNQDQVVFLDRETGVVEDWTLGSEGDHETLYEQHNPDYIPAERGGPAVIASDSENNRIVEYQRTDDGEWNQTWTWQQAELQWPRDADRLPNGHTLIVDSNGDRLIEIDRSGDVVWSVPVRLPYDAERLGTGDESATGESAAKLGLASQRYSPGGETASDVGPVTSLRRTAKALVPASVLNGIIFMLPPWMDFFEFGAALALLGALLVWAALELRWSEAITVRNPVRSPVEVDRDPRREFDDHRGDD
jgi:hypothetical protein